MLAQLLGLLVAMPEEGQAIEAALAQPTRQTIFGCQVTDGVIAGHRLLFAHSGIGKVNATLATAALAQAGMSHLVMLGMAGSVAAGIEIGDVVVATDLIQHDVDITAFGHPAGYLGGAMAGGQTDVALSQRLVEAAASLGVSIHRGRIASGDQFICSPAQSQAIAQQFEAVAVEMEGAAVAQVCCRLNIPYAILRWISDAANQIAPSDFATFTQQIAKLDLAIISQVLS